LSPRELRLNLIDEFILGVMVWRARMPGLSVEGAPAELKLQAAIFTTLNSTSGTMASATACPPQDEQGKSKTDESFCVIKKRTCKAQEQTI
jgi:hypothetical protein